MVELPIDEFLLGLARQFPGSVREFNGDREWQIWDGGQAGVLELEWSAHHVVNFCRGLSDEQMNSIIGVTLAFGAPLFDPQTGERFAP